MASYFGSALNLAEGIIAASTYPFRTVVPLRRYQSVIINPLYPAAVALQLTRDGGQQSATAYPTHASLCDVTAEQSFTAYGAYPMPLWAYLPSSVLQQSATHLRTSNSPTSFDVFHGVSELDTSNGLAAYTDNYLEVMSRDSVKPQHCDITEDVVPSMRNSYLSNSENNHSQRSTMSAGHHHGSERYRISHIENMLRNPQYEPTPHGQLYKSSSHKQRAGWQSFNVTSYNVLAQNLLDENMNLYRHCSSKYLDWNYRSNNLLQQIKLLNPDILCLQEVLDEHYNDFFEPEFNKLGYEGIYKRKTRDRSDGCATFFRRTEFRCIASKPVDYFVPGVSVLDRDNIALILLLEPLRGSPQHHRQTSHSSGARKRSADSTTKAASSLLLPRLCVANTHLLFNPKRGDVKLAQVMLLLAEIDRLSHRANIDEGSWSEGASSHDPVIICGDFNTSPFSDLYEFVRTGRLDTSQVIVQTMCNSKNDIIAHHSRWSPHGNRRLSNDFLDKRAGITDRCQFVEVCKERLASQTSDNKDHSGTIVDERTLIATQAVTSDCEVQQQVKLPTNELPLTNSAATLKEDNNLTSDILMQCSGLLSHDLRLQSVFDHIITTERRSRWQDHDTSSVRHEPESTTCHHAANGTVDYIFYTPLRLTSCPISEIKEARHHTLKRPTREIDDQGQLRLLAKIQLPSFTEMELSGGLPNHFNSSDHVPLSAIFAMRVS